MFYEKYFPSSTRDKMLSQLLLQKQGNRSVAEYEIEFNLLMKFSPEGIRDQKRIKIQKFRDGLNPELRHDIHGFELTNLRAMVNKAKMMEESRSEVRVEKDLKKASLSKRSFESFANRNFKGTNSGSNKKPMYRKQPQQSES